MQQAFPFPPVDTTRKPIETGSDRQVWPEAGKAHSPGWRVSGGYLVRVRTEASHRLPARPEDMGAFVPSARECHRALTRG